MQDSFQYPEAFKRAMAKYEAMSDDALDTLSLQLVNQMRAQNGDAPVSQLMSHEEVMRRFNAMKTPARKTPYLQRLRRAYRVLRGDDEKFSK